MIQSKKYSLNAELLKNQPRKSESKVSPRKMKKKKVDDQIESGLKQEGKLADPESSTAKSRKDKIEIELRLNQIKEQKRMLEQQRQASLEAISNHKRLSSKTIDSKTEPRHQSKFRINPQFKELEAR